MPGYEVTVFTGRGRPSGSGRAGRDRRAGNGLFSAYYVPWRLREQVTRDGWFLTGDIGWLDESGALYLEGRRKTVIFVAGLKFFPRKSRAASTSVPESSESRVFGRAHARLGEVPCAEIVVDAGGFDLDSPEGALRARPVAVQGARRVHGCRGGPRGHREARSSGGRREVMRPAWLPTVLT